MAIGTIHSTNKKRSNAINFLKLIFLEIMNRGFKVQFFNLKEMRDLYQLVILTLKDNLLNWAVNIISRDDLFMKLLQGGLADCFF